MIHFIIIAGIIATLALLVLAVGLGLGWLLHSLLPGIDPGNAVMIGLISLALGVWLYLRISRTLTELAIERVGDEPDRQFTAGDYRVALTSPRRSRRRKP